MPPNEPVALLITAAHIEEARAIRSALLTKRLVACVNFIPIIESHYWWKGNIETAVETLIIAKTIAGRVDAVQQAIRSIHSYEVFELVVLPIVGGSTDYLDWIVGETRVDGSVER